jgi:hypothetical protein
MNIGSSLGLEATLALALFLVLIIAFFAALIHESRFKLRREIDDLGGAVKRLKQAVDVIVAQRGLYLYKRARI